MVIISPGIVCTNIISKLELLKDLAEVIEFLNNEDNSPQQHPVCYICIMSTVHRNIELYKSLFRGRADIYAVRWERDGKSGYMPAYDVDWSNYEKHKSQGGTFSDFKDKKVLPYNDISIKIHIEGEATHGLYSLLEDNTSYFIAVDFDKTNWDKSILKLYEACKKYYIQSYIEKSGSGNEWSFMDIL